MMAENIGKVLPPLMDLLEAILPIIPPVVDLMLAMVSLQQEGLGHIIDGISAVCRWLGEVVPPIFDRFMLGLQVIGGWAQTVGGWIADAWNWVWQKIEGFVGWVSNVAWPAIENFLQKVQNIFNVAKDTVVGVWDAAWQKIEDFIGFVQGLPQRVSDALYGMWDGLKGGIVDALNYVIWKWNGLSFTTPDIPGTDWGGVTIDTPDIDYITAHTGSDYLRFPGGAPEGLIMARAGERVVTPATPGGGGDVYVAVDITERGIIAKVTDYQRAGGRVPWQKADR